MYFFRSFLNPYPFEMLSLVVMQIKVSCCCCSKQIWQRMQTWKDDEFLLGLKFSRVQKIRPSGSEDENDRCEDKPILPSPFRACSLF